MARFSEVTDYTNETTPTKVFIDLDSVVRVQFSWNTTGSNALVILSAGSPLNAVELRDESDLTAIRNYINNRRHC